MTSHEYAEKMLALASLLKTSPCFEMPYYVNGFTQVISFFDEKEAFLKSVKSVGAGHKSFSGTELRFTTFGGLLRLDINRDKVCRKIRDAEYECEPLLSEAETAELK